MLQIGWTPIVEPHSADSLLEVKFDNVGRWLWSCYGGARFEMGTGLYAIGPDSDDDYYLASDAAFHDAFAESLSVMKSTVGLPVNIGQYTFNNYRFQYAVWDFENTHLMLVQHYEGDGHAGHDASLDLRLWESTADNPITFPLQTNMLF